jgi:Uncharacterised protein family UPF0547
MAVPYAVPMSSSGQPFTYSILVPASPAGTMQSLLSLPPGGNYFDGYEIRQVSGNSLHITRRYVPVWAIVVAVVGAFFFLIGLLALLVRETEVLTVTVYQQEEGSYLDFSGVAAPRVATAVNFAIDRLLNGAALAPPPVPFPAGVAPSYPPGRAAAPPPVYPAQAPMPTDTKTCPECAETVRAAARSCRFCGYRFATEPT